MSSVPLRIYHGPQDNVAGVSTSDPTRQTVNVTLGEVLPLLADAVEAKRTWLHDFETDEITISMDLYEVILAYQYYRRPTA